MKSLEGQSGLLLIDKPKGITSFDIIRVLRRSIGIRKIGHAGTLDPMASGLMIMLVGRATKRADEFIKLDKTYHAEITLGATSTTGDAEGELTAISSDVPERDQVASTLERFTGAVTQTPPAYSAIKIKGVAAYKRARRGEVVDIPERRVIVYRLELLSYEYPRITVRAHVSSGTYIRTLAEDIGLALKVGAHLTALRREEVGGYGISQAHQLDSVTAARLPSQFIK